MDQLQTNSSEHYGVLGMKWGVRKNPDRVYQKAGKKLKKLDAKVQKKESKAQKSMEKVWTKSNSAQRAIMFKGVKKWRAAGQANRTIKKYADAQKALSKAKRWQTSMDKVLKTKKISEIDSHTEELGKKYSEMALNDIMSSSVNMNALYDMYSRNKTRFNR